MERMLYKALEVQSEGTPVVLTVQRRKLKFWSALLNHILLHLNEGCCLIRTQVA